MFGSVLNSLTLMSCAMSYRQKILIADLLKLLYLSLSVHLAQQGARKNVKACNLLDWQCGFLQIRSYQGLRSWKIFDRVSNDDLAESTRNAQQHGRSYFSAPNTEDASKSVFASVFSQPSSQSSGFKFGVGSSATLSKSFALFSSLFSAWDDWFFNWIFHSRICSVWHVFFRTKSGSIHVWIRGRLLWKFTVRCCDNMPLFYRESRPTVRPVQDFRLGCVHFIYWDFWTCFLYTIIAG